MEEEADDFAEAFLGFLLNLATAKDKAVRFRVCQLVAGVLNSLGPEAEVSDDLYERMEVRVSVACTWEKGRGGTGERMC